MNPEKLKKLNNLFSGRENLPTLPTIFNEFNALMKSDFVSPKKLAMLIKRDQSMVIKVISLTNVALHGKRENITDISNAVAYLGLNKLKRLILQICLSRMFTFGSVDIPDFNPVAFWEHALGTAYFAEILAKSLNFPPNENFYLGGLMHDVGKNMLYTCYPHEFEEIVFNQTNDGIPDYEAEMEVLGVDHTDIGAFFTEQWRMDPAIIAAVRDHHTLNESEHNEVTLIVHLANLFAKTAELCFPWEDRSIDIKKSPAWEKVLSMSKTQVDPDKLTLMLFDATPEIRNTVQSLIGKK
jgi:putative nucleotidyltransferase with HDIG domain